jgi:predicted extracellular nuclease
VAHLGSPLWDNRIPAELLPVNVGTMTLTGGLGVDLPAVNTFDHIVAEGLTGVLSYQFGRYVFLVDNPQALQVTPGGLEPASVAPAQGDEWTLCAFNAENLFDAVNDKDGDMGAWAPADDAAYKRLIARSAALIRERLGGCAVVGLQEIEGKDAVWKDLAAAVGPRYRYDYWESADARDITVGLLYDATRVEILGSAAAAGCSSVDYKVNPSRAQGARVPTLRCPAGSFPLFDRAPYVADVIIRSATGDRRMEARLVVAHLKSKRGDEAENAPRRVEQARYVAALLTSPNSVVLGDLNDTLGSETLAQFADFTNLFERYVAPEDRYTYIYNGRSQAIDHIIMSPGLENYFAGGQAVHVNADFAEPRPGQDGRVSDHDPVYARFLFRPTGLRQAALGATWGGFFTYHHFSRLK